MVATAKARIGITLRVTALVALILAGLVGFTTAFTKSELDEAFADSLVARGNAVINAVQDAGQTMPFDAFVQAFHAYVVLPADVAAREPFKALDLGPKTALETKVLSGREAGEARDGERLYTLVRPVEMTDGDGKTVTMALRVAIESTYDFEFLHARVDKLLLTSAIAGAVTLMLLLVGVQILLGRPLRLVTQAARGSAVVAPRLLARRDEIGALAHALADGRQAVEAQLAAERQVQVDRDRAAEERNQLLHQIAEQLDVKVGGVSQTVTLAARSISGAVERTAGNAKRSTERLMEAEEAASETHSAVSTVASATEELTASIRQISERIDHLAGIAKQAAREADGAETQVAGLTEAATRIGDVVKLINDIASQTNLLALNATIEAARAGEAGKGFAVVANEVKSLANQTAKATEDITAQIAAIQAATDQAVGAIHGIVGIISTVDATTGDVAAAVTEQNLATSEIARAAANAATRTSQVTEIVAAIERDVGEVGEAASGMLVETAVFTRETEALDTAIRGFKAQIAG